MTDPRDIWRDGTALRKSFDDICREHEKDILVLSPLASKQLVAERAKKRAIPDMQELLLAQNVIAFGKLNTQDGPIERIPREFWDDADARWLESIAWNRLSSYYDIRVINSQPTAGDLRSSRERIQTPRAPKSFKHHRIEAIQETIAKGIVDFGRDNLAARHEKYRAWLDRRYPDLDLRRGFSTKSFEADEREVKSLK